MIINIRLDDLIYNLRKHCNLFVLHSKLFDKFHQAFVFFLPRFLFRFITNSWSVVRLNLQKFIKSSDFWILLNLLLIKYTHPHRNECKDREREWVKVIEKHFSLKAFRFIFKAQAELSISITLLLRDLKFIKILLLQFQQFYLHSYFSFALKFSKFYSVLLTKIFTFKASLWCVFAFVRFYDSLSLPPLVHVSCCVCTYCSQPTF